MPCKKCKGPIPTRMYQGDKIIPVSRSRKYCDKCSPFYICKKRMELREGEVYRICIHCNKKFPSAKGNRQCNACHVNKRRFAKKRFCLDYKGNKCEKCGYNRCPQSLTFHHRNPEEKLFDISGAHARSGESLKRELDKCDLLCHNCHNEEHAKQKGWKPLEEPEYFL